MAFNKLQADKVRDLSGDEEGFEDGVRRVAKKTVEDVRQAWVEPREPPANIKPLFEQFMAKRSKLEEACVDFASVTQEMTDSAKNFVVKVLS